MDSVKQSMYYVEANDKAIGQLMKKMMIAYYQDSPELLLEYVPDNIKAYYSKYMSRLKSGCQDFLVTINPEGNKMPAEIYPYLTKALKKKFLKNYYGCFEFRNGSFEGCHVHLLIRTNKSKKRSEIQREFHNTFKDIVGNRMHVHVISTNSPQNMVEYVEGKKKGERKDNYFQDREYFDHEKDFDRETTCASKEITQLFGDKTYLN